MKEENEKSKENFCPVCVGAIPLAFSIAGGRANTLENNMEEEETIWERNRRKRNFNICILIGMISIAVIIYYTFLAPCNKCK
jgi:hypothetical protein